MFDFLWRFSKERKKYLEKMEDLQSRLDSAENENMDLRDQIVTLEIALNSRPKYKKPRKSHGCGKHCYSSSSKAKKATKRKSDRVRTYHCNECHAWHVTTN